MKFKKNDNLNYDLDESDSSAVQTPIKIVTDKENQKDAIEVLNYTSSHINIQPHVLVAATSNNIDTQNGKEPFYAESTLDNNSYDNLLLSSNVDSMSNINSNIANNRQFGECSQKNTFQFIDDFAHNTAYGSDSEDIGNSVNNTNNCNSDDVYGNRTNLDEMVAKVINLCISTNSYVKRIDARIDKIEKLLESNTEGYHRNSQKMFDDDFISLFPMKDIQTINDVDTKIKNDSKFECQMKAFITTIGGTDIKNFVKRILHRLFSNELSSKCSWTGFRTNYKLENLKLMSIIKDIAREHFKGTDISFENHVKDWFRHGTQRLSREKERLQ
ncbi:hypothetical protein ACI65C_005939 [Semiaphis heraclei]